MFSVQKAVFSDSDERLLALIVVLKSGKGLRGRLTKHNLLCLTGG